MSDPTGDTTVGAEHRMTSRLRRQAMVTAVLTIAPLTLLGVALTTRSWGEGVVIGLCFLLAFAVLRDWNLDGYPPRSIAALIATASAWIAGATLSTNPLGFVPLALVGALLLARTRRRIMWIAVFALAVAALGATSFVFHALSAERMATYVLTPFLGVIFVAAVIVVSERAWLLARGFEQMREMETRLAVARERARFASDLHDIQGQSLHVMKLKSAVAYRMVRTDPGRAEAELMEIQRLARETISETRALTLARYDLNLAVELENAKRLCESAGIEVRAEVELSEGLSAPPVLAHVLREATTNLLRHARPSVATITASSAMVEVANDGIVEGRAKSERGLARLRERVEAEGGTMTVSHDRDRFVVRAEFGREHAGDPRS